MTQRFFFNIFTTALLLLHLTTQAQMVTEVQWVSKAAADKNQIDYDVARPLTWADFKGKPYSSGREAALTASGFGFEMSMQQSGGKGKVIVTIFCSFSKSDSWVKDSGKTDYILNHEQRHFDLTYIAACNFMEKVKQLDFNKKSELEKIKTIYQQESDKLTQLQNEYDAASNHGINTKAQQQWNAQINDWLADVTDSPQTQGF